MDRWAGSRNAARLWRAGNQCGTRVSPHDDVLSRCQQARSRTSWAVRHYALRRSIDVHSRVSLARNDTVICGICHSRSGWHRAFRPVLPTARDWRLGFDRRWNGV